jgi:hypothetical protein
MVIGRMDMEGGRTRCELRTQDLSINRPSPCTIEWCKKGNQQDGYGGWEDKM